MAERGVAAIWLTALSVFLVGALATCDLPPPVPPPLLLQAATSATLTPTAARLTSRVLTRVTSCLLKGLRLCAAYDGLSRWLSPASQPACYLGFDPSHHLDGLREVAGG